MPIFQIEWGTYDGSVEYYFDAPEGSTYEQFKSLCDQLIRESAEDALKFQYRDPMHLSSDSQGERRWWLGYDFFVREVVARLPEHGYKQITFPTVKYLHGMILREYEGDTENNILGEDLAVRVCAFNKAFEEDLNAKRKERREKEVPQLPASEE